VFVVVVASRRGFVIVLSLCEDKTSFPPPLFSLWIWICLKFLQVWMEASDGFEIGVTPASVEDVKSQFLQVLRLYKNDFDRPL
jgi:hypothetical protein